MINFTMRTNRTLLNKLSNPTIAISVVSNTSLGKCSYYKTQVKSLGTSSVIVLHKNDKHYQKIRKLV